MTRCRNSDRLVDQGTHGLQNLEEQFVPLFADLGGIASAVVVEAFAGLDAQLALIHMIEEDGGVLAGLRHDIACVDDVVGADVQTGKVVALDQAQYHAAGASGWP